MFSSPGLKLSFTGEPAASRQRAVVPVEVTLTMPMEDPNSAAYKTLPVPVVSRVCNAPT